MEVNSAASEDDAVEVGRAIRRNNLLKVRAVRQRTRTGDASSRRIGTTQAAFDPDQLDVLDQRVEVCRGGAAGEPRELVDLSGRIVQIGVQLHAGNSAATILTNDLSHGYVEENSAYSS